MEKLPPTSYVRLVDIWLICGQLTAFIEVILITLRELYNEEEEINHHGFVRRIRSFSQVSFQYLVLVSYLISLLFICCFLKMFFAHRYFKESLQKDQKEQLVGEIWLSSYYDYIKPIVYHLLSIVA